MKISFYFLFPSFPVSSPSSHPFQFLSEDILGILSSSIFSRWPNQLILCPFIHFTIFSPLSISFSSLVVRLFHSPFSFLGPYILPNIFLSKISRACSSFLPVWYGNPNHTPGTLFHTDTFHTLFESLPVYGLSRLMMSHTLCTSRLPRRKL